MNIKNGMCMSILSTMITYNFVTKMFKYSLHDDSNLTAKRLRICRKQFAKMNSNDARPRVRYDFIHDHTDDTRAPILELLIST